MVEVAAPFDTWIPKQAQFFQFEPKGKISTEAILGSWGFGKTTAAARKFLKRCIQNPWREVYGGMVPQAAICAPTYKILSEATVPKFLEACPRELILKKRGLPTPHIQLINGAKIFLVSAEASMEGLDLFAFWIDEISHDYFAKHREKYVNYMARLRDPHARVMSMIVSGLPLAGFVRETFDFEAGDPDRVCVRGGITDNPYVPKETHAAMLEACPAGWENVLLSGDWGQPPGATFPMIDSKTHLYDGAGDIKTPVNLGIDIGNHGAILVSQKIPMAGVNVVGQAKHQEGLLIVDQVLTEYESLEASIYKLKTQTEWQVVPGYSVITIDPTTRRDERNVIQKHFPKVRIVQRDRQDEFYSVENGLRHLQVCLKDALGNVRIKICKHLERQKFGIWEALQMARGNPRTGALYIKDDSRDHPVCALRYLATELLAAPKRAPTVRKV